MRPRWLIPCAIAMAVGVDPAHAQSSLSGDTFDITRAAGPITIDGALSDEGWRNATRVDKWDEKSTGRR